MICKKNIKTVLFIIIICLVRSAHAQQYVIDHTFEHSHNSRIRQNDKFGLIDENKKLLIPAIYDKVNDFHNGFAKVVREGKVGFVNQKAQEIIPCMYEEDTMMITGAVIEYAIEADSKRESINVSVDESRDGFSENMVCVIKNGKYGFVDKANTIIISFQYDGADNFYENIAIIKQKDRYGAIDKTGTIVIPLIYDLLVWDFSGSAVLYAQKDGKNFFFGQKRKQIVETW